MVVSAVVMESAWTELVIVLKLLWVHPARRDPAILTAVAMAHASLLRRRASVVRVGTAKTVSSKYVHPHALVCAVVMECVTIKLVYVHATEVGRVVPATFQDVWLATMLTALDTDDAEVINATAHLDGRARHAKSKCVPWDVSALLEEVAALVVSASAHLDF